MKSEKWRWAGLFLILTAAYCGYYAPFGVNETDGGFLDGLAWQLHQGKTLYSEVVYVRPPVPVWLRWMWLELLPQNATVLIERWLFYATVAAYSYLGSAMLYRGAARWQLAAFSLVISVHNYPAAAWHTTDGILLAVSGMYLITALKLPFWGGVLLALGVLCKQSFYPLLLAPLLFLFFKDPRRAALTAAGLSAGIALVFVVLYFQGALPDFFRWTAGSGSFGQFLQHGVFDFFRINPLAAIPAAVLLIPVALRLRNPRPIDTRAAFFSWILLLVILAAEFAFTVWRRQEYTVPFAQSRLLFLLAAGYGFWMWGSGKWVRSRAMSWVLLMAVTWTASISWGFNLPILFSTPYLFVLMEISTQIKPAFISGRLSKIFTCLALILLLGLFRYAYEFIYRNGPRHEMSRDLGDIFPQLAGVYSNERTAELYRDLKSLSVKYPDFKTLPAFPQSNYLTGTRPPLPLDWVVRREMNGDTGLVRAAVRDRKPVFFIEKKYAERFSADPELEFAHEIYKKSRLLEETPHFWVMMTE